MVSGRTCRLVLSLLALLSFVLADVADNSVIDSKPSLAQSPNDAANVARPKSVSLVSNEELRKLFDPLVRALDPNNRNHQFKVSEDDINGILRPLVKSFSETGAGSMNNETINQVLKPLTEKLTHETNNRLNMTSLLWHNNGSMSELMNLTDVLVEQLSKPDSQKLLTGILDGVVNPKASNPGIPSNAIKMDEIPPTTSPPPTTAEVQRLFSDLVSKKKYEYAFMHNKEKGIMQCQLVSKSNGQILDIGNDDFVKVIEEGAPDFYNYMIQKVRKIMMEHEAKQNLRTVVNSTDSEDSDDLDMNSAQVVNSLSTLLLTVILTALVIV